MSEPKLINGIDAKRYMRVYQAKRRGSTSYKTIVEDLRVILGYEAGELSEGQACRLMGTDPVSFRQQREAEIEKSVELWTAYRDAHPPSAGASK